MLVYQRVTDDVPNQDSLSKWVQLTCPCCETILNTDVVRICRTLTEFLRSKAWLISLDAVSSAAYDQQLICRGELWQERLGRWWIFSLKSSPKILFGCVFLAKPKHFGFECKSYVTCFFFNMCLDVLTTPTCYLRPGPQWRLISLRNLQSELEEFEKRCQGAVDATGTG